jgi:hypothetical protein
VATNFGKEIVVLSIRNVGSITQVVSADEIYRSSVDAVTKADIVCMERLYCSSASRKKTHIVPLPLTR